MILKVKDTGLWHYGEVNCFCGLALRPQTFRLWVRMGALSPAVLQLIRGLWYSTPCGTVVVLCCFCAWSGYNDRKIVGRRSPECGRTCTHTHAFIQALQDLFIHAHTCIHSIFKYIFCITYELILTYIKYLNMCI